MSEGFQDFQDKEIELENTPKIIIIGQNSDNQILQIVLQPQQEAYINADIFYSNVSPIQENNEQFLSKFWNKILNILGTRKFMNLTNSTNSIAYYGMKGKNGNGKFIVLNTNVYSNNFFFRPAQVVFSTIGGLGTQKQYHSDISGLQKFSSTQKINPTFVLQSRGSIVIEKYLAADQKIYCRSKDILCISDTIKVKAIDNKKTHLMLRGQGWVFLQNFNKQYNSQNKAGRFGLVLNLIGTILIILFTVMLFKELPKIDQ